MTLGMPAAAIIGSLQAASLGMQDILVQDFLSYLVPVTSAQIGCILSYLQWQ
jgi:hypothetical protein